MHSVYRYVYIVVQVSIYSEHLCEYTVGADEKQIQTQPHDFSLHLLQQSVVVYCIYCTYYIVMYYTLL